MLHHARRVKLSLGTRDCEVVKRAPTAQAKVGARTQASTAVRHGRGGLNPRTSWSRLSLTWTAQRREMQTGVGSEEDEEKKLSSMTSEIWPLTAATDAEAQERRSIAKSMMDADEKKKRRARVEAIAAQREFHDLRRPHEWYPIARGMKRHIIMHVGPTNSGKTHSALQRLKEAKKGVYCGPLRLLAEQVFERLNLEGVPCDLVTGEKIIRLDSVAQGLRQELEGTEEGKEEALMNLYASFDAISPNTDSPSPNTDSPSPNTDSPSTASNSKSTSTDSSSSTSDSISPSSDSSLLPLNGASLSSAHSSPSSAYQPKPSTGHVSCTVEMTDVREEVDVALIDEYQLIGDESRGWAWTRALLGVPAKEVHLCGDTSAIDLVKALLSSTGDEITVKYYDRLSPLSVSSHSLSSSSYRPILSGDGNTALRTQSSNNDERKVKDKSFSSSRSVKKFDFSHHRKFEWIGRLRDGDAVIVFSRKAVFQYKKEIEERLGKSVCVVYGSLPPETRSQQAKRFNSTDEKEFHSGYALGPDGDNKLVDLEKNSQLSHPLSSSARPSTSSSSPQITSIHDTTSTQSSSTLASKSNKTSNPSQSRILVATDAIGLGLNLNIRRIIFTALNKFDGVEKRALRASEVRQIGGRAGRFQSLYPHGEVTSIENAGVPFIRQAFMAAVQPQTRAGLFPTFEHIQRFQNALSSYIVDSAAANTQSMPTSSSKKSKSQSNQPSLEYESSKSLKSSKTSASSSSSSPSSSSSSTSPSDAFLEKTKRSLLNSIRRGAPLPRAILEGSSSNMVNDEYDAMMNSELDALELAMDKANEGRKDEDSDFSPFESDPHLFGVYEPRLGHHAMTTGHESSNTSLPDIKLGEILDIYEEIANLSGLFFLCSSDDHKRLAQAIDHLELSLREKYTFVLAPVNSTDPAALYFLTRFASLFAKGFDVPAPTMSNMASIVANPPSESRASTMKDAAPRSKSFRKELVPLRQWEQMYKILDLYLWLSYRFEGFTGVEEALESKIVIETEIADLLDFNPFPDGDMSRRGSKHGQLRERERRADGSRRGGRYSNDSKDSFKPASRPSPSQHDRYNPPVGRNRHLEEEADMFEDEDGLFKFKRRGQKKTMKDFGFSHEHQDTLVDLLSSLSSSAKKSSPSTRKKKAITSLKKKVSKKRL